MPSAPLEGIRVGDWGEVDVASSCSKMLAVTGADAIKVASRAGMDGMRLCCPRVDDDLTGDDRGPWPELQPVFHGLNRNKLSVALSTFTPGVLQFQKTGDTPTATRHDVSDSLLRNNYPCAGDDAWVSFTVGVHDEWDALTAQPVVY